MLIATAGCGTIPKKEASDRLASRTPEEELRVLLVDAADMRAVRSALAAGDPCFAAADQRLLREADAAMTEGPFSVMDKEGVPRSGDQHDYMSMAPNWCQDPDDTDARFYLRRDNEVNPEATGPDRQALGRMCAGVATLATAYFLSDHEAFAEHAALLLRTWFLNEGTRMNPHLEYARGIPGRCGGRSNGIMDAVQLTRLLDAVAMLASSPAWSREDQRGLESWFDAYRTWLAASAHGQDECGQADHRGTWYDVQMAAISLFLKDIDTARATLIERTPQRMAAQLEPDGRQPLELRRTQSLSYALMNLLGMFDLATLSRQVGCDLWHWRSSDGRSIRQAFYWLLANGFDESEWGYPQVPPIERSQWVPLLRRGGIAFDDPECESRLESLDREMVEADRTQLLYPHPARVAAYRAAETGKRTP